MIKECFKLLKVNKDILSKQQYKTLKGQILAKDFEGFKKGLVTIQKRNELNY